MKRQIAKILLLCLVVIGFVGCSNNEEPDNGDQAAEKQTLIVGTNPEFPPFEYVNSDQSVDGFDLAMIKEIAKRLNYEVEVKSFEFKSLIGALQTDAIDVIAAAMTVRPDRQESVDFTDFYFEAKQYIIVKQDSTVTKLSDLNGKKIAAQEGTTGDYMASGDTSMAAYVEDGIVSRFKKPVDAIMELKSGRVDAVIVDSNVADAFLAENTDLRSIEEEKNVDMYALAVKKGDAQLLKELNDALAELKEDGTIDRLIKQYIVD